MRVVGIWAESRNGVMGAAGKLPWRSALELQTFRAETMGSPVIMGHTTWLSLPPQGRPLSGRPNIVLTRGRIRPEGAIAVTGMAEALHEAKMHLGEDDTAFVIGGARTLELFANHIDAWLVSIMDLDVSGDTFGPTLPAEAVRVDEQQVHDYSGKGPNFTRTLYQRAWHEGERSAQLGRLDAQAAPARGLGAHPRTHWPQRHVAVPMG